MRRWQEISIQDYIWIRMDEDLEMTFPTAPYQRTHKYTEYSDIHTGQRRLRVVDITFKKSKFYKLDIVSNELKSVHNTTADEFSLAMRSPIAIKRNENKRGR
jgi:hypothetical protein